MTARFRKELVGYSIPHYPQARVIFSHPTPLLLSWCHSAQSFESPAGRYFQQSKETIILSHLSCHTPVNKTSLASLSLQRQGVNFTQWLLKNLSSRSSVNSVPEGKKVVATWHDYLVAGGALGGELVAVAVAAHQSVALAGEGLVCQRAVAAETAKTVCVVMSVLVEELLEEEERVKSEHLEVVKAVTVKNGAVITTDKVFNRNITEIQCKTVVTLCLRSDVIYCACLKAAPGKKLS